MLGVMSFADPHEIYALERAELIRRLRSLNPAQAATPVPSCPAWTVKDVAAHLSGLVVETLANVPPPRGSDEATARQVSDRAQSTLNEVCDEWEANAPAFDDFAAGDAAYATTLTGDLAVHAHDIAEALLQPADEMSVGTLAATERYLGLLQERAAEQLDVALTVDLIGVGLREASAGSKPLKLAASPYAFLRSVTGRRSRSDVADLDWAGDPSELLDNCFTQYGVLTD